MGQDCLGLTFGNFCCAIPNYISMMLNGMGIFPSILSFPPKFEFEKTHYIKRYQAIGLCDDRKVGHEKITQSEKRQKSTDSTHAAGTAALENTGRVSHRRHRCFGRRTWSCF
jgi:hypothetical protein